VTPGSEQLGGRVVAFHWTARTLVVAFTLSIFIYTGVGLLILNRRGANPQTQLPYPFYAAAAVLAIGSIVFRRSQLHSAKLEIVAARRGVEGLIKHLFNVTIIAAAIAEAIGLLALIVTFFGGDQNDVIRLGIVALVVSLYNYPRRTSWQRAVDYFAPTMPSARENPLGL
jgi:hypothetical protein